MIVLAIQARKKRAKVKNRNKPVEKKKSAHSSASTSNDRSTSRADEEDDEEILGSDDDEQEDPKDYCKGNSVCYYRLDCMDIISCSSLIYMLSLIVVLM